MLNDAVAFTSGVFEGLAVADFDGAANIFDETSVFQHADGKAHAGPSGASHLGEEFVGQIQHLGIYAVLAHQQPASEALFEFMQTIASSHLCHLKTLH